MKFTKSLIILLIGTVIFSSATAQSNAFINVLTQNSGLVNQGGTVFIQVTVGNTGPTAPIGVNKVRVQLSLPAAICTALPNVQQTGLPPGWTITVNTGGVITVCNGSDIIAVGVARTILIKVQGNNLGGPSTVTGNLLFSNGTSCTIPGTLPGDALADNSSTSSIQVVPATQCIVAVSATAGNVLCFGGTTTLTASSGQPTNVEYSLNGGAFQTGTTFTVNAAGSPYTVVARKISDISCTAISNSVTVTQPASALSATASVTHTTTVGGNDGTATATPAGGTPGYTYLWSPGSQTTQTATALTAGTYTATVTDVNGCITTANATVEDPIITPLTLIDFNAKLVNCQLILNWITDNEINTDRFEIERAGLINSSWVSTGVVAANGKPGTKATYQFIDKTLIASPEEVLYRLKMIDRDGHYKNSKILHVLNDCKNIVVDVYPNPARDGKLYLELSGADGDVEAILVTLSGQLVLKSKIKNGVNDLNISNMATGEYILKIKDANGFEKIAKVFIQN